MLPDTIAAHRSVRRVFTDHAAPRPAVVHAGGALTPTLIDSDATFRRGVSVIRIGDAVPKEIHP